MKLFKEFVSEETVPLKRYAKTALGTLQNLHPEMNFNWKKKR